MQIPVDMCNGCTVSNAQTPLLSPPPPTVTGMDLTDTELAIIAIEKQWWQFPGGKESAAFAATGLRSTAYHQALNRMLDDPRVESVEPHLVRRLRRVRDERRSVRASVRLGTTP